MENIDENLNTISNLYHVGGIKDADMLKSFNRFCKKATCMAALYFFTKGKNGDDINKLHAIIDANPNDGLLWDLRLLISDRYSL